MNSLCILLTLPELASIAKDCLSLIAGVLPAQGIVSVYGLGGSGKTFFYLHMAAAIARGASWFGYQTQQAAVVIVALEGLGRLHLRGQAWEAQNETQFPDNVRFLNEECCNAFSLIKEDSISKLADAINLSGDVGVIIIDTLNRAAPGCDENNSYDMGNIIAGAEKLRQATGALVMLIHHSGKEASRGLRGHSSLHGALDTVIEVKQIAGERHVWQVTKSRDGRDNIAHNFELRAIELNPGSNGNIVESCAVVEIEGVSAQTTKRMPSGKNQKPVFAAFLRLMSMRRAAAGSEQVNGIPYEEAIDSLKNELSVDDPSRRRERTKDAIDTLIGGGFLVVCEGLLMEAPAQHDDGGKPQM